MNNKKDVSRPNNDWITKELDRIDKKKQEAFEQQEQVLKEVEEALVQVYFKFAPTCDKRNRHYCNAKKLSEIYNGNYACETHDCPIIKRYI